MRREWLLGIASTIAASGAAALAYATQVEPFWLKQLSVDLSLPRWPRELDGLTVLHLSDMHVAPGNARGIDLIRRAVQTTADLVLMTGDYGDIPEHAPLAAELLRPARGRIGTFAVLGNHDYATWPYVPPHRFTERSASAVTAALEATGVTVLRNQSIHLNVHGHPLWIVGLDDPHTFHDNAERAFVGVPSGATSIALAHSWEPAPVVAEHGSALLLSGHTHGGQVRLPLLPPPVHNAHRRPTRIGGLFWVGDMAVSISHGLGGSYKLRFMVRPQAVLFTVRSAS